MTPTWRPRPTRSPALLPTNELVEETASPTLPSLSWPVLPLTQVTAPNALLTLPPLFQSKLRTTVIAVGELDHSADAYLVTGIGADQRIGGGDGADDTVGAAAIRRAAATEGDGAEGRCWCRRSIRATHHIIAVGKRGDGTTHLIAGAAGAAGAADQ